MKKPKETIGIRTHDLPASSAMPQPAAPPRTRVEYGTSFNLTVGLDMYQSYSIKGSKDACEHNWQIHHTIRHETCPSLFFVSYTLILKIISDASFMQKYVTFISLVLIGNENPQLIESYGWQYLEALS
jgi:hypothetical protein